MASEAIGDPDEIAASPPRKLEDPKFHFQTGAHQGMWLEYDERGVPTKNIKKKKPTKKERDELEQEYLNAKKLHLNYLKDLELWEQRKVEAEAALKHTDKFRWAFRQINADQAPLSVDDLHAVLEIMGWDKMSKNEFSVVKKKAEAIANEDRALELEAMRYFTKEQMPALLIEERLNGRKFESFDPETLYSPRTWRGKLEDSGTTLPAAGAKKGKTEKSPRGNSSARGRRKGSDPSPRGDTSPRSKYKKEDKNAAGDTSPRSKSKKEDKSPTGDVSPRSRNKAKREMS